MEVKGLEPLTYGLQSHRSSQLSYTPEYHERNPVQCSVELHGTFATRPS